ncbi:MAG TPA: TonB-dependent receptor [Kofleriaceae bacterium]|nr:TonB-dependent receptor [Kofleriaceae bacterium]
MRVESMRRVLSLGVLVTSLWLCGLASTALAQDPGAGSGASAAGGATLTGVVTSDSGGGPLVGATVGVPALGVYELTDERGRYALVLPPGTHVVRVESPGHRPLEQTAVVGDTPAVLDLKMAEDRLGEVIVVVGSRTPRSRLETSVPVDVVTNDVLTESSHTEMNQILNTVAPSFNASHLSISDGTDHIDPASLRGLGPEHVLVLVNGRRLHQSALINIFNGGTVGVDLNAIPANAIARIEVLRDGAASQYGSDAIAGVINIVLKDNVDLVNLYTMTGITAHNDGAQFKLGANTGWALGKKGYLNVTGELFARGRTNRSGPWTGDIFPGVTGYEATNAELARRGLGRGDFKMSVGQAGAVVGTTFLNAGYKLDDTFELHAHGGYTARRGNASGFYRFPASEARVDLRIYPNGFLPEINPWLHAWTGTVGVRGKKGPWDGDLSLTHGGDVFHFYIENSLNASLGTASPTSFDAGALRFNQTSLNLDGVYKVEQRMFKSVSAVGGAELRREGYGITAGQEESYELGPETTADGTPKVPGSQVFPGFRPTDESDESRLSGALYAGVESQPTARTNLDIGGRFEHYNDFGSTVIGKLAGRVSVLKEERAELALRGAASTGFRAPGLQQIWYSTIATNFVNKGGVPTATQILISPNRSPVTEAFGVPRLKEETSVNFSGGFTSRLLGSLSLSADFYRVQIKDRVVLSGLFDVEDPVLSETITDIVSPFPGVGAAQFYINAVDTTTNGVDIVLDHSHRLPKGVLKTTAAVNFTKTRVDAVNVPASMEERFGTDPNGPEQQRVRDLFLGRYGKNRLEDLAPRQKGTLGLRWEHGRWSMGARANYFGPTEYHSDSLDPATGEFLDESFGAEVTFDVDVGYRIGGLWWSIGANNVFDNFPDQVKREENRFNNSFLYSPAGNNAGAPYGMEGCFYYARAEYKY